MLSSIYAKLASIFLSKIIPSIDTKQISFQNKDGLVMLENLEINPILLIKEKIPFNIQRGIIKSMNISIDSLPNGLAISCNDIYIFTNSREQNFFKRNDSKNFLLNLKTIFHRILTNFTTSIGSIFDYSKIRLNIENFHFIFQKSIKLNDDLINDTHSLLNIKIPTISFEPILNENDQTKIQRTLNLSSISISFYNNTNSDTSFINLSVDEFINSMDSIFTCPNSEEKIDPSMIVDDFSISIIINSNHEESEVKINSEKINIKTKLNQFYHFMNSSQNSETKNQIFQKIWFETFYKNFLRTKKYFNIDDALSFLKNREKYVNLISSETDSEKVDQFLRETEINQETEKCLKFYANEVISEKFNGSDQLKIQLSDNINFFLEIPSISIDLQDEKETILSLKFDQLNGHYQFGELNNGDSFTINDFYIDGTKVSESQPFLCSQYENNEQSIQLSKCLLVIKKEYENDGSEKVDTLKMLDIEKQLSEYKMLIHLISLLGQSKSLNYLLFFGNKKEKMTFNGQSFSIHLQYFNTIENSNLNDEQNAISELPKFDFLISINSYAIQFNNFQFKNAVINFDGFSLNKNQILLPLKLMINLDHFLNALIFSSEIIELKMNGVYFKTTIDIFKEIQSALNIKPNFDLIVKIKEIKIHLSVNLIVICHDFISHQKVEKSGQISSSFNKFKILDCNRLFLSFDSFIMKQNRVFINNLIFILNAPALNYLFSVFSFNKLREKFKLVISNISVKLPFSEVVIIAQIDQFEFDGDGRVMIDRFTAKSSQDSIQNDQNKFNSSCYLIDPISFNVSIAYDEDNHVVIGYRIDQVKINFGQEEIKNLLELFSFFKNFLISKNVIFTSKWEFKSIKFSLRKPKSDSSDNGVIAFIEMNSFSWEISSKNNEFSSKIECQSIKDLNDKDYKFLTCNSPVCLSFKQVDKNVDAFITFNDVDLFLSPELVMFNIDLYGISKINIANYEYVVNSSNINVTFYSNKSDAFESFHLDELRISSIQKGNFSFSFKNIKSLSKAFELTNFDLQMVNSVITYKMPDGCIQIETDSQKLEKIAKFFSEINFNLPSFLTFGLDININLIKIKLKDTNQLITISKLIFKLNASEKVAVMSTSEISYEKLFSFSNINVMIEFHVNDSNSTNNTNLFEELNDRISIDMDVKGDVLNPIHYEYINVLTKIDNFTLTLNQKVFHKFEHLFNYHFMKLFNRRNNKWIVKEITLNLFSFNQELSFILKNVDGFFSFNEKKFHLKINDANILPGNLLTKKSSDETFISVHYDFCHQQINYLSILIKESVLKLDTNKFLSIYSMFDSLNTLIPISLIVEKILIIFDNEKGSPFHIFLNFKITKNIQILDNSKCKINETVFEFDSDIFSMNFVERKPLVQNMQLSLKIDNNRNLSFKISDCTFLLSLFVRELIKSLIGQLKKMSFLLEDSFLSDKKRFLINSISIVTGKISIIFCKVSFQPLFRITLSPFSTEFSVDKVTEKSFDVFSSIDFVNDKINDWDYLVEPFKLSILPSLQIFKDDNIGGVYHHLTVKVNVNQNVKNENLNVNLPLFMLQNNDVFDDEEKELFEKLSKNNELFELPDLFIKNNLNTQVTVNISPQKVYFVMVPQQLLPIYIDESPSLFEVRAFDKTFKFSLDEIIYPTIFSTCLSIVKRGRRIELNSPVQIQSCINRIVIELYDKGEGEYFQLATLEPGKLYPLYFNSNKPKECLLIVENDKIIDKKHHNVSISPFESESIQNAIITAEHHNYYVLININNDKSGKIVKLNSSVICHNLLPFSLFIRIKNNKNETNKNCDQLPICKNETVDLLSVNPEIGSKFYAELSMNGIDYSSLNKLIIELSPSKETSIHESSSMNFLLDLNSESSLKLQTMKVHDCRIEEEITINVKFEKLVNGQIRMILFSPFIFANLTDSDLMILNGNSITHLPIHNWSVLTPKTEGLIFTQKDDKIVLSIDGYEKHEIQYYDNRKHHKQTYFQTLFLEKENEDVQNIKFQPRRKSSAFDSFINLFSKKSETNYSNSEQTTENLNEEKARCLMPLRLKISKYKFGDETLEVIISDLITVQNDTDISIDFEYVSVSPHSSVKIKNIKKVNELSFHFDGSQIYKTISLDKYELNESFRAAFLIEDNKKIEIDVINQEVNLLIVFKNSTFPTPLIITNELLDGDNQPISLNVYHTNKDNLLYIPPFTSSPFYFDDLQNLDSIHAIFILNSKSLNKEFKISLLNETSITEISDLPNNLNFLVTVKINQDKQSLKSVIFSAKNQLKNDQNILNFFRFKVDLNVPSIMTSVIDFNMNEILLMSTKMFSFSIDNTIDFDTFLTAFLNNNKLSFNQFGIQTICNFSIKSLQVDIQSNIIPRVFSPTIFKSNGASQKDDDDFISVSFFTNPINKYMNVYLCDSMSVSSDPFSLSFFMKLLKGLKSKFSFGKFDWFEVSPFSFHFSYQESNGSPSPDGSMTRRRASFSIADVLNNNPKSATVSIPGVIFGQFDGNFLNEVIQIYLNKFIKPTLTSEIPGLLIQLDKDAVEIDEEDIDMTDAEMMTEKVSENLTTSYGCINRSSLVSLALFLVNEKMKAPQLMINIIAGLTSYSKNVKKLRNGFVFYFNTKNKNRKIETEIMIDNNKKMDSGQLNDLNDNSNNNDESRNNANVISLIPVSNIQNKQQQWIRIPRCYPRFIIGIYNEDLSHILILIRNRFRNKERVRMVSKCTVTNDVVVLTDSYLIIIRPTLEYISNEISILEIQSVTIVESELRIAGKKESEKMMLRLENENDSKIFSIFIASQRLSLGMFGMSMIDQ